MDLPNLHYPDPYDFVKLHQELIRSAQPLADRNDGSGAIPEEWKLPTNTVDWTPWITPDHTAIVGEGGFGTVYFGKWTNVPPSVGQPPPIVVKVVRVERNPSQEISDKRYKKLRREITVWNDLKHPHIVPFVGICRAYGRLPALISPYMRDGDVLTYVNANSSASKGLLIIGIALGLEFLHHSNIVHGDLKAANVLVNKRGWPCLVDFGVSRMVSEWNSTLWCTTAHQAQGTVRWQAPELIDGTQTTITAEGDVYAWAMTSLEILTGCCPYSEYRHDIAVLNAVVTGQPPYQRPNGTPLDNSTWQLYVACWKREPKSRPSIEEIVSVQDGDDLHRSVPTMLDLNGRSILSLLAGSDMEGVVKLIKTQSRISPALIQTWRQLPLIRGVETLLQHDRESVKQEDSQGKTPIYYASECGFLECVGLLLFQGVDVLTHYDHDINLHPLHPACENGHDEVVRILLMHCKPPPCSLLDLALCNAVQKGALPITQILLDFGANVNVESIVQDFSSPMAPLQVASAKGYNDITRLLLDCGADVRAFGGDYGTAVVAASEHGHENIVRLLLSRGAVAGGAGAGFCDDPPQFIMGILQPLRSRGAFYEGALQAAAYGDHKTIVQLLLEHGTDVPSVGKALLVASYWGHEDIVEQLLDFDASAADVGVWRSCYVRALQYARSQRHESVVQLMVSRGPHLLAGRSAKHESLMHPVVRGPHLHRSLDKKIMRKAPPRIESTL